MSPQAYWSEEDRCWYVPVSSELLNDASKRGPVEPVRIEIRDGQMWITQLESRS